MSKKKSLPKSLQEVMECDREFNRDACRACLGYSNCLQYQANVIEAKEEKKMNEKLYEHDYDELIDAIYNKAMNDKRYCNAWVVEKISELRQCFKDEEKT